jgi:hypothetical protein
MEEKWKELIDKTELLKRSFISANEEEDILVHDLYQQFMELRKLILEIKNNPPTQ